MKKLAPKIDLGRTRGYPFAIAWVYLPVGLRVFTGSMDLIEEHLKDQPTSHGFVKFYRKTNHPRYWDVEPRTAMLFLFGRLTIGNSHKSYIYCYHTCQRHLENTYCFGYLKPYADKRMKYILVYHASDQQILIGKWRKMPPCHLKQMADFEQSLNKGEKACV